ncbi:minor tail protein [Arthrobacter phage Tank]|uniref:Tail protein n=1 Tax=Arthrobacter phage Tank TaxID=1772319 RepID=A0A0U4KS42_9CAUD|nr:minor tail protein [Arthrobacter phage Tank]ALY10568.1 tail protein [Arthrobacter phage Tank]
MATGCTNHTAFLYDRGGERQIGQLDPLERVKWGRVRDDISEGNVWISSPGEECAQALALAEAGRVELVIFRGPERVWEGPVTRLSYFGDNVQITAKDVMYYTVRTIMRNEYDNRHPNTSTVLARVKRVMEGELARKEALDPPINVLEYVQYMSATAPGVADSRTASRTLKYETTVFNHVDNFAARGGLDYTVNGRSIQFFDVHERIGQTAQVTRDDFIGEPVITQYGAELATYVAMTDGKGNWGDYPRDGASADPYYGEWEVLHQAYDETAPQADPNDVPTVAEMRSQAQRAWLQGHIPPLVVRVPDNTRLNPEGVLQISDLVPGVWIPLRAELPGRTVSQMQKLDKMTVEEKASGGEEIKVVLSPAYQEAYVEE